MKIYKPCGDIIELNTAEYRELFLSVNINGSIDVINTDIDKETEPTESVPQPKADHVAAAPKAAKKGFPAKKVLDDPKIKALRDAGWSWEKIADEMRCSTQTAINHYNAYMYKLENGK